MTNLSNEYERITGAASGIGRATALKLAKEGSELALLDCDEVGLAALMSDLAASPGDCFPVLCDLNSEQQIEQATKIVIQKWQALDILMYTNKSKASILLGQSPQKN